MESVFKSCSWEIEDNFESKEFNSKNLISNDIFLSKIKLKYLQPIYYNEEIRIDIELSGNIELELNNLKFKISSDKLAEKCVMIKNNNLMCDGSDAIISNEKKNFFKLLVESNTMIKKFTIIQDLKIDGCNPNN